jgi:hypothetical protein
MDKEANERHAKIIRAYGDAKAKSAELKKALLAKGETEEEVESGFTCMECRIKFAGRFGFERHNLTEHSAQSGLRVPDEMQVMASACVVADAETRTVLQCESFEVKYIGHGGHSTTVGEARGTERGAHMYVPWQGSAEASGWVDSQTTVMREERLKEGPSARKVLSLPSPGAAKHLRAEVKKLEAGCASSSIKFCGAEHNVDAKVKRSLHQRLNWVMDHESGVVAEKIAKSLRSSMIASPNEKMDTQAGVFVTIGGETVNTTVAKAIRRRWEITILEQVAKFDSSGGGGSWSSAATAIAAGVVDMKATEQVLGVLPIAAIDAVTANRLNRAPSDVNVLSEGAKGPTAAASKPRLRALGKLSECYLCDVGVGGGRVLHACDQRVQIRI